MVPILPIIAGLAQFAPAILPLLTKNETAQKAAEAVSRTAKSITGCEREDEALHSLSADPALAARFQQSVNERAIALYREETARLEAVNQTIRAEVASADPYVRRWRPTFGYIGAFSFGAMMLGLAYTILVDPAEAANVAIAIGSMSGIWTPLMAVLGVAVWSRSQDKKPPQVGPLSLLARRITGG
jgi:hypothetical protein